MLASILLPILLFIAGVFSVYFYLPNKKFYAWLQSFVPRQPSSTVSSSSSTTPQVSHKEMGDSRKLELKRVFATFDKNGDGFITKQELRESFKNLRLFMSEKEAEEMVVKVDANGDGSIDFEEFCVLCQGQATDVVGSRGEDGELAAEGEGEDELKEAFDVFDKDRDGLISVEELGYVLCSLGLNEGKKMEDCKAMIRKVDMDGDGMVNFEEFKRMMKGGGKLLSVF